MLPEEEVFEDVNVNVNVMNEWRVVMIGEVDGVSASAQYRRRLRLAILCRVFRRDCSISNHRICCRPEQ